jgi:very-short-patch-repair endonuclease
MTRKESLRRNAKAFKSKYEKLVFEVLSAYFPHFNIQVNVPMKSFDGCPSYIKRSSVDILVPELNLVVEINGEHHYRPMSYFSRDKAQARYEKQLKLDRMKRLFLEEAGYTVVVFSTDELDAAENTADLIIERIKTALKE